jgi:type IV secretory pathway VirB2 component (pilin)
MSNEVKEVKEVKEAVNNWAVIKKYYRCMLYLVILTPHFAHAALGESFLDEIVDLLTSTWARAVGIIAVAIAGYLFLFAKQIEKELFIKICLGLFFIFGSATIVDELADWVGD